MLCRDLDVCKHNHKTLEIIEEVLVTFSAFYKSEN